MASQLVQVSGKEFTLSRRLRASGSDTSIYVAKAATNTFTQTEGVIKINTGQSSEWVSFTGTTVTDTQVIFTGCVRGLKQDATSITDADSSLKFNHAVGIRVIVTQHSVNINTYVQEDRDNTITGLLDFSGTTAHHLRLPRYTTTQKNALASPLAGHLIFDTSLAKVCVYTGAAWETITSS